MYAKSAIAGALLAAAPIVNAAGSARVSNQCNFPVYLWTVSAGSSAMKTLNAGEDFSEGYLINPNGGGVSMKIATEPSTAGAVTQFEYTLDSTLWYDISNINGWPFEQWGLSLLPSVSSCRSVLCAQGVELCSQAYNQPDEDWATAACTTESDMTLVLCSGQADEHTPSPLALAVHQGKNISHNKHKGGKNVHLDVNAAAAPPAAPAPAAPAAVTTAVPVPDTGAMTTFVTNIVTVTARNAQPSVAAEEPVRRHMHQHHHHHHA